MISKTPVIIINGELLSQFRIQFIVERKECERNEKGRRERTKKLINTFAEFGFQFRWTLLSSWAPAH